MPSIYLLKPKFQAWLRPLARTLAGLGVTANRVTLAACAISIGFGLLLTSYPQSRALLLLLPVLLFLRMALNAMDGMLAREFGQKSEIGTGPATLKLYGIDNRTSEDFGRQCLMALGHNI